MKSISLTFNNVEAPNIGSGMDYMLLYNLSWLLRPTNGGCDKLVKEYVYYPILNIYDDIESSGIVNSYWPIYLDKKIKNTTQTGTEGVKIYAESPIELMAGYEVEAGVDVEINVVDNMPARPGYEGNIQTYNYGISCAVISGPSKGDNSGTYEWCAHAANGYPPYTFTWEYKTDSHPYYSPWYNGQCRTGQLPQDEHLYLKVTVTDSRNNQDEALFITLNDDAGF